MNKIVTTAVIAATFSLAACSQAEEAAPVAEETVSPEPVAMTVADGKPAAGTFEITQEDGSVMTQIVNADGTYTNTTADGTTSTGTWTIDGPNRFCDKAADAAEQVCYNETVGADGVWTSVNENDPADTSTIVRKM